jgi:hypothetical protein
MGDVIDKLYKTSPGEIVRTHGVVLEGSGQAKYSWLLVAAGEKIGAKSAE